MANTSYNNERPAPSAVEIEYPPDPASGGFFQPDYKKHDDLKQMLDSSKDSLKLEAMKRIIGMVAKGRDASDLFPAVVKNVVSKNIEVKKLVYVYLVRYAEEQQDLALLSISTFQRALKDPNQLIRASALRVLSSIRVEMIVPIVMLAIKESASDMSPYVRKTAAHAIPKLYSLDPDQKEELVSVIKKLLSERTIIVIGSAVMAYSEVCPERSDLIHRNFRKLCTLLVDVDEWGQLVILNVLTRYARENFCDPNAGDVINSDEESERPFYESDGSQNSDDDDQNGKEKSSKKNSKSAKSSNKKSQPNTKTLDPDHRLLLRSANPLLQSRNAGVVMAVSQLYYHAGPASELSSAARAMVRLLRGPIEVQSIVLHSIASLTISKKSMFGPYLKTFFVRTSDPTHIKLLKLEILSNLATESSVPTILREFQTYITSSDKTFVAATIQAIDRCAANIKTVTDTCLQGLLDLLSNKDEAVVAESVIVIKKLLQSERSVDHKGIINQMVRLLDHITVGAARAAILWLLGEYRSESVGPDVLRKCAKTFVQEDDIVKLQVLNLAVKLCLTNPSQTRLLAQYVFTLARYDPSYDIRDRARFLKRFVFPSENDKDSSLLKNAQKLFLVTKPAPLLESKFKERQQYTLGSLSHYVSGRASGYTPLPPFPSEPSSAALRETPNPIQEHTEVAPKSGKHAKKTKVKKFFYSETEESSPANTSSSEEDSSEKASADEKPKNASVKKIKKKARKVNNVSDSSNYESDTPTRTSSNNSDSESDSGSSSSGSSSERGSGSADSGTSNSNSSSKESHDSRSDSDGSSEKNNKQEKVIPPKESKSKPEAESKHPEKSNLDLLLELGDMGDALPIMTPTYGGFLSPIVGNPPLAQDSVSIVSPSLIPLKSYDFLSKISGRGLSIIYRFTRAPHLYSNKMVSIELFFSNQGNEEIKNINAGTKGLSADQSIHPFAPITSLGAGCSQNGILGIDFNDTTQPAQFIISTHLGESQVSVRPPVGELMRSVTMSDAHFQNQQKQLRGMTQVEGKCGICGSTQNVINKVYETSNMALITSQGDVLRFAGQTLSSQCLVLLTIQVSGETADITINCDKMVIGSMLMNEIKSAMSKLTS